MKTIFIILILLAVSFTGCSRYRVVRNQRDQSATWNAYRTFAFVDTNRIDPVPGGAYQTAIEQIKRAVAAELNGRGYQLVANDSSANQSDLLVNVGAVVNEKTQTRPTTIYEAPRYIGQRRYSWQSQEVPVGTYKEGTLSLHVVDRKQNALVWDAAVSGVLGKKGITAEQINEAVHSVFAKFPGKQS